MARFLADRAKVSQTYCESEVDSSEDSDEEQSDEIPYQNSSKNGRQKFFSSESDHSAEVVISKKTKRSRKQSTKRPRRKSRSRSPSENALILSELKKTNEFMSNISKKMKRHESRLSAIENKLSDTISSCSSSTATPKRSSMKKDVPVEVRRETRRVYNLLLEDVASTFEGWKIEPGITFRDPQNQSVVNVLIQEVQGLNPAFLTQHIRDAAYRFYRSRNEDLSSKRRGTFQEKGKLKRRHERLVRKFHERKKMFEEGLYKDDGEKEAWKKIMVVDFMSTDESCTEEDQEVLMSKPLPWLSEKVAHFKQALDEAARRHKSPLARRQMKPRRKGLPSTRSKPCGDFPAWVFNRD